MEHGVGEEGLESDVAPLLGVDEHGADRLQYPVEFGPHGVLQLQPAGTLFKLHLLIVGQVDGDSLRAGITVAGIVDHIIGVQIRI